jgi:hypothetical protein
MRLFELKKGGTFYETKFDYLYHITDHHGFAYTVDQNALRGLRQGYVSTTFDPKKNGVFGYSHYDFKFVLDAKALVSEYGGFYYDHHIQVGDRRKLESLDEREIGVETKSIEPFDKYLLGVVLLMPMFSQKAIQWLLYDNSASRGFMGPDKSAAPRTIETLYKVMVEWKKPIWMAAEGGGQRKLTDQEIQFLKDVMAIHTRGGDFDAGMRKLAAKYPIKDHWNKDLDQTMVVRRQKAERIYMMFNKYYQDRRFDKVDPNVPRKLMAKVLDILKLNNNIGSVVMGALEDAGLFHQAIAPVDWGIIIKPLMDGDVDEALEAVEWVKKDKARHIQRYEDQPEDRQYSRHAGTRF